MYLYNKLHVLMHLFVFYELINDNHLCILKNHTIKIVVVYLYKA